MLNGMKLNTLKIEHEGRIIPVGFSAGVAHFPRHAQSKSELMKFADLALYKAKISVSNIKVFNKEIAEQFDQKYNLLDEFKIALSEDKIIPFYQPIIDLKTQKLYAYFTALLDSVRRSKPPASEGTFFKTITVTSTMGPGVRVDPNAAIAVVE